MQRREFLKDSARTGLSAWAAISADRICGANDRIRVGLIGCGGRGTFDARLVRGTSEDIRRVAPASYRDGNMDPRLRESGSVEIAALCDVQEQKIAAARKWAPQARTMTDFRKVLEDKEIDAVIIATPDHWHAQMLILACDAQKDAYVEKPVMYHLNEGPAMIQAVRRSGRIVQVGTQHRSADHIAAAARMVQSGKIGEVRFVRAWNYMSRSGSAPVPDADPPDDLDWDAWLGPAPKVPFNRNRLNYRLFMDYSNGIISDFGTHRFDSIHQIMSVDTPRSVASSGIRFNTKSAGELLDIQQATYEYESFILSYEACIYNGHGLGGRTPGMRYYGMRGSDDRPHGMAFYGTEAALFVDRIGMELYPELRGGALKPAGQGTEPAAPSERMHLNEDEPTPLHAKNFMDCVRSRREPNGNIEAGVRAAAIACIGNIAFRTGRKLKWDAARWLFPGDEDANRNLFRPYRKPWDLVKIG